MLPTTKKGGGHQLISSVLYMVMGILYLTGVQGAKLESIAYREKERNVIDKGNVFSSERFGVYFASYAGDTDMFIRGEGFNPSP